jgi:hypothetical protein
MKTLNSRTRRSIEDHEPSRASGVRKVVRITSQRLKAVDAHVVGDAPGGHPGPRRLELHPRLRLEALDQEQRGREHERGHARAATFWALTAARGSSATRSAPARGRKTRIVSRLEERLIAPTAGR